MTEKVIARTVFEIVESSFRRQPDVKEKCFRIKNLSPEVVAAFAEVWEQLSGPRGLQDIRLVVADNLGGAVPSRYVAEAGKSITYYRNHNLSGLVYLETKVQSDAQGLQNIFTLRDSNFLDRSFDNVAGKEQNVPRLILSTAWQLATGTQTAAPSLLADRISDLIEILHPEVEPVPVWRFVSFASELCSAWNRPEEPNDEAAVDRLVGEHLWHLDLFPDELWRSGGSKIRIQRRLEINARHAELTNGLADLDPKVVEDAARQAHFRDLNGQLLPQNESDNYRDLCVEYVQAPTAELLRRIPYRIFEQLFRNDTKGLQLGDRMLAELRSDAPSRVNELYALDVITGLNSRSQYDAERFINAQAVQTGEKPLVDLLTNKTRGLIERLASPPARGFFNPGIELARIFQRLRAQWDDGSIARLSVELSPAADADNVSIRLFAFLFGRFMTNIADMLADVPGACQLVLDPRLTNQGPPPPLKEVLSDIDGGDGDNQPKWLPVPLKFVAFDVHGQILESIDQMEWLPRSMRHFALTWLLIADQTCPIWQRLGAFHVNDPGIADEWLDPLVDRLISLETLSPLEPSTVPGDDSLSDQFLTIRGDFQREAAAGGLSIELFNTYLDRWKALLMRARQEYVPDGKRISAMDALLSSDMLVIGTTSRRLMLPTHPIRLRWLAHYFTESQRIAFASLSNEAEFGAGDGEQYLSWIENRSPYESPAITLGHQGELLFAKSDLAWYGDFAPLQVSIAESVVDRSALASIVGRVTSYLNAHPYKHDGLAILLVLPSSDQLPAEFLDLIRQGSWKNARISIVVAAPKIRWEQIARNVELTHSDERTVKSAGLFPPTDLSFVDYDRGDDLAVQLEEQIFDIAIVTHVLHESVTCQQNTEPPMDTYGEFRPLHDRPVWMDANGDGGSISILLRPRDPDPVLESWGTLVVRAHRTRPVAPAQAQNIDFAELRVNFDDTAKVFNALHSKSHWVITLERHISREQIESVEAGAPYVLSLEEGIGNNGLNTLIVSSRSGKELIESRLVRKLHKLMPTSIDGADLETLKKLASRIYDETRHLSPHLALKAMGVSRETEEILGLAVARSVAEEREPLVELNGFAAWLSLDEHVEWFGGSSAFRSDMCRLAFTRSSSGDIDLDVLVLEGKLRQFYDGHGVTQVKQTMEFFNGVLTETRPNGQFKLDSAMWRERILAAIESSAPEARMLSPFLDEEPIEHLIPEDIRQVFREGRFRLRSVKGIYSICHWTNPGSDLKFSKEQDVLVVRSTNAHLFALVQRPISPEIRNLVTHGADDMPDAIPVVSANEIAAGQPTTRVASETSTKSSLDVSESGSGSAPSLPTAASAVPSERSRMDPIELRRIYEEILACFASHSVSVSAAPTRDDPVIEGPASILFKVRPAPGVDPRKLAEKSQALKLSLGLEQDQSVGFGIDRGYVTVDLPKSPLQRYYVDAGTLWQAWKRPEKSLSAPIGEDRLGRPVDINFSAPNSPHLLVGGTTGSGKSEALNTILFGLVRHYGAHELRLLLVDPKGTELSAFEDCKHLEGRIGWDDEDAILLMKKAVDEMQRRYVLFRENGFRSLLDFNEAKTDVEKLPWWLIVLDEYADLTHDAQKKKEIEHELKRLAQKARASGIHVVIATQKPSAEVISTNLRSNLPAQLALRVKSATESRVLLDEAGAEILNGKGDAILKSDGKLNRVQCARVTLHDQNSALMD